MSPDEAALLCVIFILWLFRRLSRESRPLSRRLWVPLLWLGRLSYHYSELASFRERALETVLWLLALSFGYPGAARADGAAPGKSEPLTALDFAVSEGVA